jgi:hypothetical protein
VFRIAANSIYNKYPNGIVNNKNDSGEHDLDARLCIMNVSKILFVLDIVTIHNIEFSQQ